MYISLSLIITSAYYAINILRYVSKFLISKIFNEKNTLENTSIDIIELYKNGKRSEGR